METRLTSDGKSIEREQLLHTAMGVARDDGEIEDFKRIAQIPIDICPRGGTIRYDTDFSLPKHSVLVTITRANGDHHYTLGLVRHESDEKVLWTAHS